MCKHNNFWKSKNQIVNFYSQFFFRRMIPLMLMVISIIAKQIENQDVKDVYSSIVNIDRWDKISHSTAPPTPKGASRRTIQPFNLHQRANHLYEKGKT